jgi:pimeloyl-ACP methyl ester carboxylesterase
VAPAVRPCAFSTAARRTRTGSTPSPAFDERFHVVSLDQRGHGESAWAQPPAYASEDFAADLLGVMDGLGWGRATLVGHSMGGHNAMSFAAWHPERVTALVIVDSRPSIPADRLSRLRNRVLRPLRRYPSPEAAVDSFRLLPRETVADRRLLAHLARSGLVERDGGWFYRFDPECNGSRRPVDSWRLLGGIAAPTLIVRGELSPVLSREMAAAMREAIPRASVVEVPATYHHLVLDAPAAFVDVLDRFLASPG